MGIDLTLLSKVMYSESAIERTSERTSKRETERERWDDRANEG